MLLHEATTPLCLDYVLSRTARTQPLGWGSRLPPRTPETDTPPLSKPVENEPWGVVFEHLLHFVTRCPSELILSATARGYNPALP